MRNFVNRVRQWVARGAVFLALGLAGVAVATPAAAKF